MATDRRARPREARLLVRGRGTIHRPIYLETPMTIRGEREPSDDVGLESDQRPSAEHPDSVVKPRWSRPEITSFNPVSDTQSLYFRIGDGINNLS